MSVDRLTKSGMNLLVHPFRSLAIGMALMTSPAMVHPQTAKQSNVIENTVALQVAQSECGYKVNTEMLQVVMNSVNLRPSDLSPGGKYWGHVERNQARVRRLTATSAGKASFCRNIRHELSAMFD